MENFFVKKKLALKSFGLKKSWSAKILVRNIFGREKYFIQKIILVGKFFGQNFFGRNFFWSEFFFGWKFFLGWTFFLVRKLFRWERSESIYACWPLLCLLDSSSDWVKMMLHTKNQLPRLGGGVRVM